MSQLITRNEVEDFCKEALKSKFWAIMDDLIPHAAMAGRKGDGPGILPNR